MARKSKNKQREITVHHYFKTWRSVNTKHFKNFESFFSVMMKLALMRTATGKEDPELPLLQWISSLDLPASEIASQINASRSLRRHISTSTVQRRLRESGLHGWVVATKPLKDTNKKTCLGQETQSMDIRPLESCPFGLSPNLRFLVPTAVS